ncbi:MAG: hypothetical protein ACYS9H_10015, partial [Planctomycetota bacterium]
IDVEMELSTQACYVGQPVILTVSFYTWTDIVRAEQIGNIEIQIPFLQEGDFYQEDVDSQLKNTTQTALPVNGRKEYVYQDQVLHKGVNCVRVRFIKVLIPKRDGLFELDDASVTADLAVGQKKRAFWRSAGTPSIAGAGVAPGGKTRRLLRAGRQLYDFSRCDSHRSQCRRSGYTDDSCWRKSVLKASPVAST